MTQPCRYRNPGDVEKMRSLLVQGRKAATRGYYVHPGDLNWWLYYTEPASALWQHIYLWDSEAAAGKLDGWALISPAWTAFDVFVRAELRGSCLAHGMYAFAEEQIAQVVRERGDGEICTVWVGEGDDVLVPYLEQRGFHCAKDFLQQYRRSLEVHLELPVLPPGFRVGQVDCEEIAVSRAVASKAAFGSDWDDARYLRRYQCFRSSPVYRPELDVVVLSPDGGVAAFCYVWLDEVNCVGLFEPVGVHPEFQRMGLGKAVLAEGMRRMARCGMKTAIVCAESEAEAANRLYRSAGLQPSLRLLTYQKGV